MARTDLLAWSNAFTLLGAEDSPPDLQAGISWFQPPAAPEAAPVQAVEVPHIHIETPDGEICSTPSLARAGFGGFAMPKGAAAARGGPAGPEGAVIDSSVTLTAVPTGGVGVAYGDTFSLHSLPTSGYKIYLDFDGHTTTGTAWNSYWNTSSFYSSAYSLDSSESFTATELLRIQQVWQRVAEYFAPFNIDVTTEDPGLSGLSYSGAGDNAFGIRVVVTDEANKPYGGIGYVGSYDWNSDTPVYVYANQLQDVAKYIADAAAHEAGHSLGLSHDGQTANGTTTEYYYGYGSGVTDWAPVMGAGYYANIVQWSNGGYYGANQTQDDLAIITTQNSGVGYRADEAGGTFASAASLVGSIANGVATVQNFGVIAGSGTRNDIDMYSFNVAAGGSIDLAVASWTQVYAAGATSPLYAASPFSMLDVSLALYDGSFNRIATSDDISRLDGRITVSGLAGGTYYLAIDGTGWGDPLASAPSGYSDYGSLGQYMIQGTYSAANAVVARLELDKTSLQTTEAGASDSFTIRAVGATSDVAVQVSGLDSTEGRLSASSLVLNAANNWTASVVVSGLNDRDDDGTQAYSLQVAAGGLGGAVVNVANADNDIGLASIGKAVGSYSRLPTASGTLSALALDDGKALTLTEGSLAKGSGLEWRWQFTGLQAGDKLLHLDAYSGREAFRVEYSVDGAASWKAFQGAPSSSSTWNGDWLAQGVGNTLWVRLVDTYQVGDKARDTILVDLLTLEDTAPAAGDSVLAAPVHASPFDWLFG